MKLKTIMMDTDKFISIPGNPNQRDTKFHARKALKYHLSTASITQSKVAVARCGKLEWKLDGHTRAYLWKEGDLKAPKEVSVDVYTVTDKQQAIDLYKEFDNHDAVESNQDKLTGALRLLGLEHFDQHFARNSGIINAVQTIELALYNPIVRGDIVALFAPWKKEIKVLLEQQWSCSRKAGMPGIPGCVVGAFLITTKLYKQDCLGFWDGYYYGVGVPLKSGRDGCTAAIDWINKVREDDLISGRRNTTINIQALLVAYQFYRARKPVQRLGMLYSRNHRSSAAGQLNDYLKEIGFPTNKR